MYSIILVLATIFSIVFFESPNKLSLDGTSEAVLSVSGYDLRGIRDHWVERILAAGATNAYAEFLDTAENYSIDTHTHAHLIGEALYKTNGLSGIQYCDESFTFGCFHSFFGMAVDEHGVGVLKQLDEYCTASFASRSTECQHGIGHGILIHVGYENLVAALDLCLSVSPLLTGGCTSGVFMEYNFLTMQDSTGSMRERGENLLYPCDALPQMYEPSCYYEQVQWWSALFFDDPKKLVALCEVVTETSNHPDSSTSCYSALGHYTAATHNFSCSKITEVCEAVEDSVLQQLCYQGLKNMSEEHRLKAAVCRPELMYTVDN